MNTFLKVVKERLAYFIAAAVLSVALIIPGIVSAAQVTERSIGLSSASASAENVSYQVKFTVPAGSAGGGAFGIEFCSNSPDTDTTCSVPGGMVTTGATSASAGFTTVTTPSANTLVATGTIAANNTIDVTFDGITNPTAADPLYARIATYANASDAETDVVLNTANGIDKGGVAISITPTIGVSAAVLESMTFCVANQVISKDCGDAADTGHEPTLQLGETTGSTKALTPSLISTGTLYTQISTNAASGAVIYLKSGNACGGLMRLGAGVCDIAPALTSDFSAGVAKFGVRTGTGVATVGDAGANGVIQAAGVYSSSAYAFNYLADNTSGVTSPMGDLFLNTNSKPVNNQNMPLTFGASISNSTPAGNYSTSLSMIATGKF